MQMKLAWSLLVQWYFYAVCLERNNNGVPIRGRCKSPIFQHQLLHIKLSLPNLISYRIGNRGRHHRGTYTHTNTRASHIIRLAFWLVAFTVLDWQVELLNQWMKHQLPSYCPDFLLLLLQIRTLMHIGHYHSLPPADITLAQTEGKNQDHRALNSSFCSWVSWRASTTFT